MKKTQKVINAVFCCPNVFEQLKESITQPKNYLYPFLKQKAIIQLVIIIFVLNVRQKIRIIKTIYQPALIYKASYAFHLSKN